LSRPAEPIWAQFVPRLLVQQLATVASEPDRPSADAFHGAVIFADVSGFTALTESFAARGPRGVEELTRLLNDYFGRLIGLVDGWGGDVVKFAGDAVLALWRAPDADPLDATLAAVACAHEIQQALTGYRVAGATPLSMRLAVSSGALVSTTVGGVFGRWELTLAGDPLRQVAQTVHAADPGQVLLSAEAAALLGARVLGDRTEGGALRLAALAQFPSASAQAERAATHSVAEVGGAGPPRRRDPQDVERLRGFIPRSVIRRIEAGQTDWLGELRKLSILFVHLPEMGAGTSLEDAHRILCELQQALYRYEGSVNKVSVDDKGATLVAAFGLPPLYHEDDPLRALEAARDMHALLPAASIGIATGRVYCGVIGSEVRREYTMMGRPANLASRLMVEARGGVLADSATHEATLATWTYRAPREVAFKGLGVLPVWEPIERTRGAVRPRTASDFVGREAERAELRARVDALASKAEASVTVVEGEAGIGKSRLLATFIEDAEHAGAHVLLGGADAVERTLAYRAWQSIALDAVGSSPTESVEARRERVANLLAGNAELAALAPLLNGVLPLELPDTPLTAQVVGEARAASTRRLLIELIERGSGARPVVVAIDDAHWMDSASWALCAQIARELPVALVLFTRPLDPRPAELDVLLARGRLLRLAAMSRDDVRRVVARSLRVERIPGEILQLIEARAEGHPFFSEEIAYALRDAGWIEIRGQTCHLAGERDLSQVDLPDTVQGIITSRIDRLAPEAQLTLKVASVIGRSFLVAALDAVHPLVRERDALLGQLRVLSDANLTSLDAPDPALAYIFKHVITQEVAYGLMLFEQRQRLHRSAAEWYERDAGDDASNFYPLLAHHWGRAGVDERAIDYLERAAERALRGFANHEVIAFLGEAFERSRAFDVDPLRKARWEAMLGEAQRGLGRYHDAGVHLERAIEGFGFPVPASLPALVAALLRGLLRQLTGRHRRVSLDASEERARVLQAANVLERSFMIYFFRGDDLRMLHSALAAANLAERLGAATSVLARSYGTLHVIMASLGLEAPSRYFAERGRRAAAAVDQLSSSAWVALAIGVAAAGRGRWQEAEPALEEAARLAERLGDGRNWCEIMATLGTTTGARGAFGASIAIYQRVLENAERRGDYQNQGWGILGQARSLLALGELAKLDGVLARAEEIFEGGGRNIDFVTRFDDFTIRALCALARDDEAGARAALTGLAALFASEKAPKQWMLLHAYGNLADAALELWRRHPASREDRALARDAARKLDAYARQFACGRARAAWVRSRVAEIAGRTRHALREARRTLEIACAAEMRYEEWLCRRVLSGVAEAEDERSAHAARAAELRDGFAPLTPPA
jgi:class 3 adenylate cyclase